MALRRRGLRGGKIRRGKIRIGRLCNRLGRQDLRFQTAFVDQAVDHAGRHAGLPRRFAFGAHHAVGEKGEHARARRRHARRRRPGEPHADALARRAQMLAHAQGHAQHHAARAERVIGHPIDELAQLVFQRRNVELLDDVLELVMQAGPRIALAPDDAGALDRAERNADEVARLEIKPGRNAIGIGLVERDRHQDIDDLLLRHGRIGADSARLRKGEGRG